MQSVRAQIDSSIEEIEKEIPYMMETELLKNRQATNEDAYEPDRHRPIQTAPRIVTAPGRTLQEILDTVKCKMDKVYEKHTETLERPDRLGSGLTFEVALLDNLITLQDLVHQMRWEVLPLTWGRAVS